VTKNNFYYQNDKNIELKKNAHNQIYKNFVPKNNVNYQIYKNFESQNNVYSQKDKNFKCFVKYNFTEKKIFNSKDMVDLAMKENKYTDIILKGKKDLHPTINVKINDYFYSSYLFSPKKIYKLSQSTYNDFFDKELDMSKLNIKNLRDIITNLIEYSLHLKINEEIIPFDYLVYTLYLLRNHEKKYTIKNK
jgi:hypothetical protein